MQNEIVRESRVILKNTYMKKTNTVTSVVILLDFKSIWGYFILFIYLFILVFSRAASVAYGGSPVRGRIGAVATSLHHSHSNARSLSHWARPWIEPASSWMVVRFIFAELQWELQEPLFLHRYITSFISEGLDRRVGWWDSVWLASRE